VNVSSQPDVPQAITRQQLYDDMWSQPLAQVAEKYGFSDTGLARVCKRYEIPYPKQKYWDRVAAGEVSARTPLPSKHWGRDDEMIDLRMLLATDDGLARNIRDPDLARLAEAEKDSAMHIEVSGALRSPHPLVARTLQAMDLAQRSSRYDRHEEVLHPPYGRSEHCLDVAVGRGNVKRAMRIMDAVVRACEARGYQFAPPSGKEGGMLCLSALGETFELRLREPTQHVSRAAPSDSSSYVLTGKLRLELKHSRSSLEVYTLQDTENTRLEDKLDRLMVAIIREVDQRRQRTIYWDERRRDREVAERKQQEVATRREQLEKEQKSLLDQAASWRRCREAREFIAAVRQIADERWGKIEAGSHIDKWLEWADRIADTLDPLAPRPSDDNDAANASESTQ
jgi:hypothetical protein